MRAGKRALLFTGLRGPSLHARPGASAPQLHKRGGSELFPSRNFVLTLTEPHSVSSFIHPSSIHLL